MRPNRALPASIAFYSLALLPPPLIEDLVGLRSSTQQSWSFYLELQVGTKVMVMESANSSTAMEKNKGEEADDSGTYSLST